MLSKKLLLLLHLLDKLLIEPVLGDCAMLKTRVDPLNEVLAHLDQVKGRDLNVASLLQVLPDGALNQERGGQVG